MAPGLSWGSPPIKVLTRTIEYTTLLVRETGQGTGEVTATFPDCVECESKTFAYDSSTVVVDENDQPIASERLPDLNLRRALLRYRIENGKLIKVQLYR
jgi:hypothetical protein